MDDSDLRWGTGDAREGARVIAPAGRVDESTASAFGERLNEEIAAAAAAGARLAVIDLASIDYMSSRGLRALTLAQRRGKEGDVAVVLAQPNAVMREILAISRYDMVFKVFGSVEDAVAG